MKKVGRNVNRAVALILAFSICLSLLVGTSFAIGSAGPYSTPEEICELCPNAGNAASALNIWKANGYDRGNYYYLLIYYPSDSYYKDLVFISCSSRFIYYNSHFYCEEPGSSFYYNGCGINWIDSSATSYISNTTPTVINGVSYYRLSDTNPNFPYWPYITSSSSVFWANFLFDDGSGTNPFADHNLDARNYEPNLYPMIVEASKSSQYGGTYLSLRVRSIDVDSLISFGIDYTSSLGSFTAYVFYDDLILYPGDDYDLFLMNPNYISSAEFTVTGVTFYGVNGNVSETGLSLVFNEDAYSYDPINLTYTYFNQFTEVSYNGGTGVPYFDQTLYFYTDGVSIVYFWDASENLVQPFKFSVMAFPSFSSSYPYAFYLNDLPEYVELSAGLSDVLLLNVSESCFDRLYGAGSYLNFGNLLGQAYPDTELMTEMLNNWYASHNMQYQPLPFSESYVPNYSESATVYLTSSFFFRQVNYSLGDTADILNEFSVRFFQQDGFSHNLFQSLNDIGSNEDSFFKDAIMYLSNINYSLNDLKFNDTLQDIKELLQSVNQGLLTLNSLDGSLDALVEDSSDSLQLLGSSDQSLADLLTNSGSVLSLLTDGNGDISSILQWLEDSSVVTSFDLDLPSFDFGGIVSTFGGNIDSFGDWVNELVLVLPDLDYSDFDDWFMNAGNLLTGVDADSNFLRHLGDPYDYSDSGVNYLGWD